VPMHYEHVKIAEVDLPRPAFPFARHMLETYASETNKVASVWHQFGDMDLDFAPVPRASTVKTILSHQLLSERRFFGEFLGTPEPPGAEIVPDPLTVASATARLVDLARARLPVLAAQPEGWWLAEVPFFDVVRERAWIFWRRLLHTTHHRTQLTVYLRLMGRKVPPTYGPTADATWAGADPTHSAAAAERR